MAKDQVSVQCPNPFGIGDLVTKTTAFKVESMMVKVTTPSDSPTERRMNHNW